ncbi:hypothetical protein AOE01nite_17360 [Acetobacter oeni]|uniref:Transposase n=1 Tax=Acetobacter oeni TaxID=304077 RepID=A0A511XKN8_9PROT|nr:hypothetical protein [Acetobacter oeni]GEN63512.1 hypothetical protein AOE01nite_17360 [Acetobacter oeni]
MYTWHHLIENFFRKLREFRRVAMRADKNFSTRIYLAVAVIHSRWIPANFNAETAKTLHSLAFLLTSL